MNIIVIGEAVHLEDLRARFNKKRELKLFGSQHDARTSLGNASAIFDFILDEDPTQSQYYSSCNAPVFINSIRTSLRNLLGDSAPSGVTFFGFNGLPTFLTRPTLEVSIVRESDRETLSRIMSAIDTPFEVAPDRPGMISARVVCMIVNEAFCAIEDGTANASDIDTAMKLGTNYPYGPVEWGRKIGLKNVIEILSALGKESSSNRYVVCDLLREEADRE